MSEHDKKPVGFYNSILPSIKVELQWLRVLIMSHTHFRVNLNYVYAWMASNFMLETSAISEI